MSNTKKYGLGIIVILVLVLIVSTWLVSLDSKSQNNRSIEAMNALDKMEIAFIGSPNRQEIKSKMDQALTLYKLSTTEENYSRAGSTLVALRKEYGIEEMKILDYMIKSHVPGVNISFPDAAGIAVTSLVTGN